MQLLVRKAMHIRLLPSGLTKPTQNLTPSHTLPTSPPKNTHSLYRLHVYMQNTRAEILSLFCTHKEGLSDHFVYLRQMADTAGRNLPL